MWWNAARISWNDVLGLSRSLSLMMCITYIAHLAKETLFSAMKRLCLGGERLFLTSPIIFKSSGTMEMTSQTGRYFAVNQVLRQPTMHWSRSTKQLKKFHLWDMSLPFCIIWHYPGSVNSRFVSGLDVNKEDLWSQAQFISANL
jgi:hypothetical protein